MKKWNGFSLKVILIFSLVSPHLIVNAQIDEVGYLDNANHENLLGNDTDINDFETPTGVVKESSDLAPSNWLQGFKSQFKHDITKAQAAGDIERSQFGIEYQGSVASGWFMNFKSFYRYYGSEDILAKDRGGAYGRKEIQRLWFQYSQNQCAHTIGRQVLVWGEVDGTFSVDVVSPLDFSEQLFTDYDEVRVAQDMWVMDCYLGNVQTQFFVSHESKTHVFPEKNIYPDKGHEEWGGRIKLSLTGLDLTLMVAQLESNIPVINDQTFKFESNQYQLLGASFSKAHGRLLMNGDMAYKTKQVNGVLAEPSDTVDVALGVEYTLVDNQHFSAGMWQVRSLEDEKNHRPLLMTVGWNQNYLHDELAMSLLSNFSQQSEFQSITVLAAYKLTDIVTLSSAVSFANRNEKDFSELQVPAKQAWSVSIKMEI